MAPSKLWTTIPLLVGLLTSQTRAAQHTLGLSDGFLTFSTPSLNLSIVKDSQTAYSLRPFSESGIFDFVPYDEMTKRDSDGQYHLGDVTFRVRTVGSTSWISGDSSQARKKVNALQANGNTIAAADLSPTLPTGSLLNITRRWEVNGGHLQLLFDVTNTQNKAVEIGALGAPLEFNNVSPCSFLFNKKMLYLLLVPYRFSRTGPQRIPMPTVVYSIHTLALMQVTYK